MAVCRSDGLQGRLRRSPGEGSGAAGRWRAGPMVQPGKPVRCRGGHLPRRDHPPMQKPLGRQTQGLSGRLHPVQCAAAGAQRRPRRSIARFTCMGAHVAMPVVVLTPAASRAAAMAGRDAPPAAIGARMPRRRSAASTACCRRASVSLLRVGCDAFRYGGDAIRSGRWRDQLPIGAQDSSRSVEQMGRWVRGGRPAAPAPAPGPRSPERRSGRPGPADRRCAAADGAAQRPDLADRVAAAV